MDYRAIYYGLQILHPDTREVAHAQVNLTQREMELSRERWERAGWKTKVFGPFANKWPE